MFYFTCPLSVSLDLNISLSKKEIGIWNNVKVQEIHVGSWNFMCMCNGQLGEFKYVYLLEDQYIS